MKIEETPLKDCLIVKDTVFNDDRGYFFESFNAERFAKFQEGIYWLRAEIEKTGARLIHLTPPDYDELRGKNQGYSAVLDRYTDWLLDKRTSSQWEVIDIHYPM